MNLERTVIYRWTHERADPTGETIAGITSALKQRELNKTELFGGRCGFAAPPTKKFWVLFNP